MAADDDDLVPKVRVGSRYLSHHVGGRSFRIDRDLRPGLHLRPRAKGSRGQRRIDRALEISKILAGGSQEILHDGLPHLGKEEAPLPSIEIERPDPGPSKILVLIVGIEDQQSQGVMRDGLVGLGVVRPVFRPFLPSARSAAQAKQYLPLHIQVLVFVQALVGPADPVSDEDDFRLDMSGTGWGHPIIVISVSIIVERPLVIDQSKAAGLLDLDHREGEFLEICSTLASGLQAQILKFLGDPFLRPPAGPISRFPPFHAVVGQLGHIGQNSPPIDLRVGFFGAQARCRPPWPR